MALYKVTDREADADTKPRVVKANSAATALRHIAGTRFDVEVVTSATQAADLLTSGIVMEVAGEDAPVVESKTEQPEGTEVPDSPDADDGTTNLVAAGEPEQTGKKKAAVAAE